MLVLLKIVIAADLNYTDGTAFKSANFTLYSGFAITSLNDGNGLYVFSNYEKTGPSEGSYIGYNFSQNWSINKIGIINMGDGSGSVWPYNITFYVGDTIVQEVYYNGGTSITTNYSISAVTGDTVKMVFHAFTSLKSVYIQELLTWGTEPVVDTCTAPASGNWAVNCADNCDWTTAQNVPANITISGSGHLALSSIFTFTGSNQYINIGSGCLLEIKSGGSIQ